jgi:hypothetical protein
MDGLTSAPVNAAPAAAPAPAPAPAAPAAAPMQPMMQQPTSGSKIGDIFKRMNMVEIGFGILGATALYFTIYYYRYHMTMSKSLAVDLQNKVDDLEIKVSDMQSAMDRDLSKGQQQQAGQTFF